MKILLDTCAFLWLILDRGELSEKARQLFQARENELYLSVVSAWEIAVKLSMKRLDLPKEGMDFIVEQRKIHGIEALILEEVAALHVVKLPHIHRDPFDRLLICQSIVHGLALMTPDPLIGKYPVNIVW